MNDKVGGAGAERAVACGHLDGHEHPGGPLPLSPLLLLLLLLPPRMACSMLGAAATAAEAAAAVAMAVESRGSRLMLSLVIRQHMRVLLISPPAGWAGSGGNVPGHDHFQGGLHGRLPQVNRVL